MVIFMVPIGLTTALATGAAGNGLTMNAPETVLVTDPQVPLTIQ